MVSPDLPAPLGRPCTWERIADVKRSVRRAAGAVVLTVLLPLAAGCGFSDQTDQPFQYATGTNNRTGMVYVLNALVVSGSNGSGRLVAGLTNQDQVHADTLVQVSGSGLQANITKPVTLPPAGLTNLAKGTPITVTGSAIQPGGIVTLTFTFGHAQAATMEVPVVAHNAEYAAIPLG